MSSLSPHPARPATVCKHQIRPRASRSAGLAEPQPRCVLRRQPRPVADVMPGARVMFVAVAAFPSAVSPDDLPAAERAVLLAGRCGDLTVCHLRDPLRCRLAVRDRSGRRVHRGGGGPAGGCGHSRTLCPRRRARATIVLSGGRARQSRAPPANRAEAARPPAEAALPVIRRGRPSVSLPRQRWPWSFGPGRGPGPAVRRSGGQPRTARERTRDLPASRGGGCQGPR